MRHPKAAEDIKILVEINEYTDFDCCEVARLLVRYEGAVFAEEPMTLIRKILGRWGLTKTQVFAKARSIHWDTSVYLARSKFKENLDWDECRT